MYDAIVVGARCAGSPTAMLLARQGYRVLLVDKATFPSDTMSSHFIRTPGVARLKRWGVLDKVIASKCPPIFEHEPRPRPIRAPRHASSCRGCGHDLCATANRP